MSRGGAPASYLVQALHCWQHGPVVPGSARHRPAPSPFTTHHVEGLVLVVVGGEAGRVSRRPAYQGRAGVGRGSHSKQRQPHLRMPLAGLPGSSPAAAAAAGGAAAAAAAAASPNNTPPSGAPVAHVLLEQQPGAWRAAEQR